MAKNSGASEFERRVKALGLPLDQIIVIGSGLLDILGIRPSRDIDLVVTQAVFDRLASDASWHMGEPGEHGRPLQKGDVEVWLDWGEDQAYEQLLPHTVTLDGVVRCVSLEYLRNKKQATARQKDLSDIVLIDEYLKRRS